MSIRLCSVAAWFTKLKGHFNLLSDSKIIKMYIEIGIQKKLAKSSKITNSKKKNHKFFFFKLLSHCIIDVYIFVNSLVRSKWKTGTKIYFSVSSTYQGALRLLWAQWMFIEEINEWVIEWFPQAQVIFFFFWLLVPFTAHYLYTACHVCVIFCIYSLVEQKLCGIMVPKDIQYWSLATVNMLTWDGRLSGLFGWVQCNHKGPKKWKGEADKETSNHYCWWMM